MDDGQQRFGDQVAECDTECLDSALQFTEGSADTPLHRLGHTLRGTIAVLESGGIVPNAVAARPNQGEHRRTCPVAEESHGVAGGDTCGAERVDDLGEAVHLRVDVDRG